MARHESSWRTVWWAHSRTGKLIPNPNAEPTAIEVRALSDQTEYEQAVALQERIWGADVREKVPACILQISQEVGGIAAGAFTSEGGLAGFVFGLTGLRNGIPAHWSHILAVDKDWRDRGVGRILKQHQRAVLIRMCVHTMYWTFDPLESRNAHLNLNVLGAVVDSYVPHFYGESAVAATDTVIGTDRFVVCWDLMAQRKAKRPNSMRLADSPSVAPDTTDLPPPGSTDKVLVGAPADIQSLKESDAEMAKRWRKLTRLAFTLYLDAGYTVTDFKVETEGRGGWYVLAKNA